MEKFIKRDVKNRVADGDNIFRIVTLPDGRVRLVPAPNQVYEEGTLIDKNYLQPIEDTLEDLTSIDSIDGGEL